MSDLENKMNSAVSHFEKELNSLRTSRANPSMLDNILVDAYGSRTPLNQLGNISVQDASTITIQVWDSSLIKSIEDAISESNLGINPQTDGQLIRLPIPKLSEERRKEIIKIASEFAENSKVAIRNIRRDFIEASKNEKKDLNLSEDDLKRKLNDIQKITDNNIENIDKILELKKTDILKVQFLLNKLNHIALILDGNKRWAKKNKLSYINGYTKGFENIKNLVTYSLSKQVANLTIFTLSSENFNRSSINVIYEIIYNNFSKTFNDLVKEKGIKIKIFGSRKNLPNKILEIFQNIEESSLNNKNLNLNIAFNYGFKDEIKNIITNITKKDKNIKFDNQKDIDNLFFLGAFPDPDILIRTGGYKRLSNFIMYNLTYTELFFTETLWPDFSEKEFNLIINQYLNIDRKYGL